MTGSSEPPPLTVTETIAVARALDLPPHDSRLVDALGRAVTGSSEREPGDG